MNKYLLVLSLAIFIAGCTPDSAVLAAVGSSCSDGDLNAFEQATQFDNDDILSSQALQKELINFCKGTAPILQNAQAHDDNNLVAGVIVGSAISSGLSSSRSYSRSFSVAEGEE